MDTLPAGTKELIAILVGYGMGCLSTGYYLVWLRTGEDVRQLGSGSTGARNVGRTLGRSGFIATMAGDMIRGALAVGVAKLLGVEAWAILWVGTAAIAGHIFPIQLRFDGGKGLAIASGVLLAFDYRLALGLMLAVGLAGVVSKRMTLSAMLFTALSPLAILFMGYTFSDVLAQAATALLILYAHRSNIRSAIGKLGDR